MWATRCIGPAGPRIAVAVAAKAARRVLPVFETAYPGDARPRTALDLVDRWLDGASVRRELVAVRVRRPVAERIEDVLLRPHAARAVRVAYAAAEYADMLHGIVGVGQLLSLAIAELQAERAHIDRRGEQLAAREAQLAAHIAEIESAAEELRALIDYADTRIAALKRLTDR